MQQISPALQARINNKNTLNQNNEARVDLSQKPDTFETSNKEEQPAKKKEFKNIAIGLAIAAVVAGVIHFIKKGRVPKTLKLEEMTSEKFKQLKADKFTGKIEGKLNLIDKANGAVEAGKGDSIVMEYVDGILKKSTRSGNVNFEKVYETIDGEKIISKTVDGTVSKINLTKLQQEVKESQEKLSKLIDDNISGKENLSAEEFQKQADAIKYKNGKDKGKITVITESKTEQEAQKVQSEAPKQA